MSRSYLQARLVDYFYFVSSCFVGGNRGFHVIIILFPDIVRKGITEASLIHFGIDDEVRYACKRKSAHLKVARDVLSSF